MAVVVGFFGPGGGGFSDVQSIDPTRRRNSGGIVCD
jgi:hypothetical protein